MWEEGVERIKPSVAAVLEQLVVDLPDGQFNYLHVLGSAFRLGSEQLEDGDEVPLFLTNHHVSREEARAQKIDWEDPPEAALPLGETVEASERNLILSGKRFAEGRHEDVTVEAAVRAELPSRDLGLLRTTGEGAQLAPVTFREPEPVAAGAPLAAMGYPLQEGPEYEGTRGRLVVSRRFAAGWLSGSDSLAQIDQAPEFLHYEIDMRAYPGISGAPCFDQEGRVVGVMRGNRAHLGVASAYGYAVRNRELFEALEGLDLDLDYQVE